MGGHSIRDCLAQYRSADRSVVTQGAMCQGTFPTVLVVFCAEGGPRKEDSGKASDKERLYKTQETSRVGPSTLGTVERSTAHLPLLTDGVTSAVPQVAAQEREN